MAELSQVVGIREGPVQVEHIYILELHQLQGFLHLTKYALSSQVPYLGGNKQLLSAYATLGDDCLDGSSKGDFVVVKASSVDVSAGAQLEALP